MYVQVCTCLCDYWAYAWKHLHVCLCMCVCMHAYVPLAGSHAYIEIELLNRDLGLSLLFTLPFTLTVANVGDRNFVNLTTKWSSAISWLNCWRRRNLLTGKDFIVPLTDVLWYLDGWHDRFKEQSKPIPTVFTEPPRFNFPERSKHRKAETANLSVVELRGYSIQLFWKLEQPWLKKEEWKDISDAVNKLACTVFMTMQTFLWRNDRKLVQITPSSFQFVLIRIARSWLFISLCRKCCQTRNKSNTHFIWRIPDKALIARWNAQWKWPCHNWNTTVNLSLSHKGYAPWGHSFIWVFV